MQLLAASLALFLAAAGPSATPAAPTASDGSPVIVFLLDNSASLPPLDPGEKRVAALEKMFSFLQGQHYRLVLFGGRREIYVDDVTRYRNDGQWTDIYFAFEKARELMAGYPADTEFKVVLVTDGIMDPRPADWKDQKVPSGADLKIFARQRLLELVGEMNVPLYVILVGKLPEEEKVSGGELAPGLVLDMIAAANGAQASPMAQSLASFFDDDGVLLKKFIFRVAPYEGLAVVERVVRRIVAPARTGVELQFLSVLIVPLVLFLCLLLGILVRSFPGPGDEEVVEMTRDAPVHVAADRMHKLEEGWATTGLSLVPDTKEAAATITYQASPVDLTGEGLVQEGLDPLTLQLLSLDLQELKKALQEFSEQGSKEEKIYALNLDYMAKNFAAPEAERVLSAAPAERHNTPPLDFLRAKTHLLFDDVLRAKLTEPRAQIVGYGPNAERKDLLPGSTIRIGRYGFIVRSVDRGGRKDARLVLYYDRIPSLLGLKTWLPDGFQRLFRFRRSSHRLIS